MASAWFVLWLPALTWLITCKQAIACGDCSYGPCTTTCDYGRKNLINTANAECPRYERCFSSCCANQLHCTATNKCITNSLKCNYDNDCGNKQDESGCSYDSCSTRYTGWNSDGGGKMVYLDRHRLNCGGSGNIIQQFRLQRDNSGSKINYRYRCCSLKNNICSLQRVDNAWTYADNTKSYYLDRQVVSCGSYGFINEFRLNRKSDHRHIRYSYYCCYLSKSHHRTSSRFHCTWRYTPMNYAGGGNLVYLDRHNLDCGAGAYLNYFRYQRNSAGNQFQYKYRCCKIVT